MKLLYLGIDEWRRSGVREGRQYVHEGHRPSAHGEMHVIGLLRCVCGPTSTTAWRGRFFCDLNSQFKAIQSVCRLGKVVWMTCSTRWSS